MSGFNITQLKSSYDTHVVGSYCVPDWRKIPGILKTYHNSTGSYMTRYIIDAVESWKIIVIGMFGSLAVTLIFMELLR